jgi:hypothetical protein
VVASACRSRVNLAVNSSRPGSCPTITTATSSLCSHGVDDCLASVPENSERFV